MVVYTVRDDQFLLQEQDGRVSRTAKGSIMEPLGRTPNVLNRSKQEYNGMWIEGLCRIC